MFKNIVLQIRKGNCEKGSYESTKVVECILNVEGRADISLS